MTATLLLSDHISDSWPPALFTITTGPFLTKLPFPATNQFPISPSSNTHTHKQSWWQLWSFSSQVSAPMLTWTLHTWLPATELKGRSCSHFLQTGRGATCLHGLRHFGPYCHTVMPCYYTSIVIHLLLDSAYKTSNFAKISGRTYSSFPSSPTHLLSIILHQTTTSLHCVRSKS